MKKYLNKFQKFPIASYLPLFVLVLLFFTIGITINNSFTEQKKRTITASSNLSKNNDPSVKSSRIAQQIYITPTIYCLGSCPTLPVTQVPTQILLTLVPTNTPISPTQPIPTTPVTQIPNTSPTPSLKPCVTSANAATANSASDEESSHKNNKKKTNGLLQQLLDLIKWLIDLLLRLLGLGGTPIPIPTPIVEPTLPISPTLSVEPSQPITPEPSPTDQPCEPLPTPTQTPNPTPTICTEKSKGTTILNDEFSNGNWQTNWVIDAPAGNLTPTAYTEEAKTDLILFKVPKGSKPGKDGTNKIMTKNGDKLGYGIYEARFKLKDINFQNSSTGVYVGMGLWNFNGQNQQEVMMGFYYEPGAHDYLQLLTTKDRPRSMKDDPNNIYHSKIEAKNVLLKDFSSAYRTIKFDYKPGKVLGYLDGNLVLTKTDLIPSEPMTLVIGSRVTGGSLSSDMGVIWDYVKVNTQTTPTNSCISQTPTNAINPTQAPSSPPLSSPTPIASNCGSPISTSYKYRVLKEGSNINVCDINNKIVHSNIDASESIQWAISNLTPNRNTQEKVITQTDLTINSTIKPVSFAYLEIRGILRMGGRDYDLINFSDQHDVTIAGTADGYGELIGQGKAVGTTGWGIRTQGSGNKNQNITFKNLKAHDFRQSGIALNKLSGGVGLVENCICNNNGQNGIGFGDSTGVIARNNHTEGNRDSGIQFEDIWNFKAINNECIANGRHNLQVEHGVGGEITSGKYNNSSGDGIQIRNRVPPDVGISENIVVSNVESKYNTTNGLIIISSNKITVQNSIFNNNGNYGLYESSGDYNLIKNNDIRNNKQTAGFKITGLHTTATGNITK